MAKPDDGGNDDDMDEDIYMSNVSALRGVVEPIYAVRQNVHEESIYSTVCCNYGDLCIIVMIMTITASKGHVP